jgi:hypothetical protein
MGADWKAKGGIMGYLTTRYAGSDKLFELMMRR